MASVLYISNSEDLEQNKFFESLLAQVGEGRPSVYTYSLKTKVFD